MRHKRVSCSPSRLAALAIGIVLASARHIGLEQQREPGTRPSPRRGDLAHPAVRTAHSRHTSVQQRAMLEEVQMPPGLVLRVVNRTTHASALSAGEPAPTRKIYVQIEPTIFDRKLAARHHPRRLQPKGQLEKIGVSHPLTIDSIPTDRSPSQPKNQPYPLPSARSRQAPHVWLADPPCARSLQDMQAPQPSSRLMIPLTTMPQGIYSLLDPHH